MLCLVGALFLLSRSMMAGAGSTEELLTRMATHSSDVVQQLSSVKCTERVTQEKLATNGKIEFKQESSYDYMVILTNSEADLALEESRLVIRDGSNEKKKDLSLLVSNGFATLFLVFHPFYSSSFQFTRLTDETVEGKLLSRIQFEHVRGMRTPAALALRGREFPLELSGTAWVIPETGTIVRIAAGVGKSLEDVGLKTFQVEVKYEPVIFRGVVPNHWLPVEARVEVETQRQHWRNVHQFVDYNLFSVNTEERVRDRK